ncbi:UDP-N-acetylglucosamine 2-epimerase [Schaalia sp. ZJ1691]|uniref:UDP-N-acetylglucosamine 2-epimerase n=1 Tax=Schaalia sp. ZJ1691 TaxID=2709404 RepID=UPI0013EAEEA0|nr:UDP-N-acetylglucosamine 2-epimerase [Schaalia sp. ZJ1691]
MSRRIIFIAGTTAELIKIAPVMHELKRRGRRYGYWSTAQHSDGVAETLADLSIEQPELLLVDEAHARGVVSVRQVPGWLLSIGRSVAKNRRLIKSELHQGIVLVHGDTFTTVIGSLIGRIFGAQVGHIEAGMRTGNMWSPFPEEINRRIVGRLAHLHFAPTSREVANLAKVATHKGVKVICTGANTVVDSLREVRDSLRPTAFDLPARYGLVTLHRFELVRDRDAYRDVLYALKEFSRQFPLVILIGKSERERLHEYDLENVFDDHFRRIDKSSYRTFQSILMGASLVVTDSGGLQAECAALGIPCAIHRTHSEQDQGIGQNVLLTGQNIDTLNAFLQEWETFRRPPCLDQFQPSKIIVDEIDSAWNA